MTGTSSTKNGKPNKTQEKAEADDATNESTKKLPQGNGTNYVENADNGININNNQLSEQLNSLSAEWEKQQKKAKSASKVSLAKSRLEQRIEQSMTSDEVDVGDMMLLRGKKNTAKLLRIERKSRLSRRKITVTQNKKKNAMLIKRRKRRRIATMPQQSSGLDSSNSMVQR